VRWWRFIVQPSLIERASISTVVWICSHTLIKLLCRPAHICTFRGQVLTDFTPLKSDYFTQYGCPNCETSEGRWATEPIISYGLVFLGECLVSFLWWCQFQSLLFCLFFVSYLVLICFLLSPSVPFCIFSLLNSFFLYLFLFSLYPKIRATVLMNRVYEDVAE
jgi:hypothetical protein